MSDALDMPHGFPAGPLSAAGDMYLNFFATPQLPGRPALLKTTATTPRRVAHDQLERLQRQFARPEGMNAAYDALESHRTLFLHGEAGSGRCSTAKVLLCELPHGKGTYHELVPEIGQGEPTCLPPELIGEEDRMLLDLSAVDETVWNTVHRDLSDFRHELLRKRAFLAVVLPYGFEARLSTEFVRTSIGRPNGVEAVARHLRSHLMNDSVWRPLPDVLHSFLDTRPPMRDVARLAERIVEARASADGQGSFTSWWGAAIEAQTDRSHEVALLVPELSEGRQRALLLATAMLHGARAEAIHRGTTSLLAEVGSAGDDRPVLERMGLSQNLETIAARLDADGCVRFKQEKFASAARRHFWTNMPDVREPLKTWVSEALKLHELTDADREELVRRFTGLCMSTGDTEALAKLVVQWTRPGAPRATEVKAAAYLLKQAIDSEEFGGKFRAAIYGWSTTRPTDHLREVLVEVCEKVMSSRHPEAALVRLHHLARRETHTAIAREGLLRHVHQDASLQRLLLARFATAQSSQYHRPDADLFLDFEELPDRFLLSRSTREWLTTCWRMVFDLISPQRWAPCAQNWLVTADRVADRSLADSALDILVEATGARYPVLSRIYADGRRAISPALASRLLRTINTAQRTHFAQRPHQLEVPPS
ncbi:hypothetical protein AB0O76_19855 [Streptomyces sp. NPDC086554]|uniref:hypothetical protein n=1 Tax=Streptomyces sp. NPDC086554 TaxID=3154864 RepID=UPI00343F2F6E